MILLDVLANGASILLMKVQHCVTHVEPLMPGISDRHSCGSTSLPALVFLGFHLSSPVRHLVAFTPYLAKVVKQCSKRAVQKCMLTEYTMSIR